jgi:hypothetical protein
MSELADRWLMLELWAAQFRKNPITRGKRHGEPGTVPERGWTPIGRRGQ